VVSITRYGCPVAAGGGATRKVCAGAGARGHYI
jgi:hypothetical protein